MIVKVQVSITTTARNRQILVYTKDRKVFQQFDVDEETSKLPLKSFWQAHIGANGKLFLDRQISRHLDW